MAEWKEQTRFLQREGVLLTPAVAVDQKSKLPSPVVSHHVIRTLSSIFDSGENMLWPCTTLAMMGSKRGLGERRDQDKRSEISPVKMPAVLSRSSHVNIESGASLLLVPSGEIVSQRTLWCF